MSRAWAEVIGDPIDHSRSPDIHGFWLAQLGIDADYRRTRVAKGGTSDHVSQLRGDKDWRGSNVTMPLKLEALLAADAPSDRAVAAGAANILMPREGRIIAGNSDVGAIAKLIHRLAQDGRDVRAITILGSGGAARAALAACKDLGLINVRLMARNRRAAMRLSDDFGLPNAPVDMDARIIGEGLINATPFGMTGGPQRDFDLGGLGEKGWLIDMVTSPIETELMKQAKARDLAVVSGLEMLVEQADSSFRLFFDAEPPRVKDEALFERLGQ